MMYTLMIKDNGPDLEIVITRAMLALAAIAAMMYRTDDYYFLNLASAVALFIAAIFIKLLLARFRISKIMILSVAAAALFIATRSIAFAVILLANGYLVKFLTRKPMIQLADKGIIIKKTLASALHQWNEFSNVILKDSILTLDFKNNKLVQVNIDEINGAIDENDFNSFCNNYIK